MRTVIVGAGIAGLWIADRLCNETDDTVLILEKEGHIGGRVLTSAKHGYEIGAGRIDLNDHYMILALVKRFGVRTYEHAAGSLWKALGDDHPEPNTFAATWAPLIRLFATLSSAILATHTLKELAAKTIGTDLLIRFPYRAEMETLRADLAIHSFMNEMSEEPTFGGIVGGLSMLTKGLADSVVAAGGLIELNTTVTDVQHSGSGYRVLCHEQIIDADRVILALPVVPLRKFAILKDFEPLKHLTMKPLTRIYAKMGKPWCLDRLITDSPLRYIIPVKPKEGIVMISYTESQDTKRWTGLKGRSLIKALRVELAKLFKGKPVPKIEWAIAYEWSEGCSYWIPGLYDPVAASKAALEVAPGLHLVGESFSMRQAWMEGALEHAAALWSHLKSR
jgi:protoporphyrinogen oxidase